MEHSQIESIWIRRGAKGALDLWRIEPCEDIMQVLEKHTERLVWQGLGEPQVTFCAVHELVHRQRALD